MPSPDRTRQTRLTALVVLALFTLVAATLFVRSVGRPAARSLGGRWPATVTWPDGRTEERTLPIPLLYSREGLPPGAIVRWHIPVQVPADGGEHLAVLLRRPRYSAEVRWDDVRIGGVGHLPRRPGERAGNREVLAEVPAELATPGEHRLDIAVQGDMGEGGLLGEVVLGGHDEVMELRLRSWAQTITLGTLMAVAAAVALLTAATRGRRRDFLAFGIFAAALFLYDFSLSEAWWFVFDDVELRMRVRRAAIAAAIAAGYLFMELFVGRAPSRVARALTGASSVAVAVALFWPDPAATVPVNTYNDLASIGVLAAAPALILPAIRRREPAALSLGLAALVLAVGAGTDILVTRAVSGGIGLLLPTMILFVAITIVTLVIRHSDEAERYRRLVESARDGILVVDAAGRVIEANAAAAALGARRGAPLLDCADPADREALRAHLDDEGGGGTAVWRTTGPHPRHVESVVVALSERRRMLVVRDVTERLEVEAGLLRAARLESLGTIAGGLAHDFNNLLGGLSVHLGTVRAALRGRPEEERVDRMETILRAAGQLTRRLLTLVRPEEMPAVLVDVAAEAREVASLVERLLPAEVRLEVDLPPELPPVRAQPGDIEQVVVNLLLNGRDAVAERGGTVWLRARAEPGGVLLAVEDDGPGVPPEIRDRIWEPLFTTRGPGRGTGLGLAVVARLVERAGGTVEVDDRPGGGTRFTVHLPAAEETTAGAGTRTGPRPRPRARVHLSDPDAAARARNALGAREVFLVESADAPVDLVVTDDLSVAGSARGTGRRAPGVVLVGVPSSSVPPDVFVVPPDFGDRDLGLAVRKALLVRRR